MVGQVAKKLEIERVKFDKFNGYLLSDNITNIIMTMEEAKEFYLILKEEFEKNFVKRWKMKK